MRFAEAVVRGSIQLEALPDLVRAFPTWLGVTRFTRTRSQPLAEGTFCRPVYIGTVSRTVMTRPPITSGQSLASAVATAMLAASLIVWVRAKREAARSGGRPTPRQSRRYGAIWSSIATPGSGWDE
jgi:hypothetical protein